MKNLYYFIALLFVSVLGSCDNQTGNSKKATENGKTIISFEKMDHDFGTVIEGEKVIYAFRFTNTGTTDLQLTSVGTSCGCTATDYPHGPVKPGEKAKIQVTFNSANRLGMQHKKVTIRANTDPEFTVLNIFAQVIEKDSETN